MLKFSGEAEPKRFLAEGLGAYKREHFAYKELAGTDIIGVRTPKIWGCF
eukprot:SAG31_NODE_45068_length_260_cov_0.645963_1_plen_48_part_01